MAGEAQRIYRDLVLREEYTILLNIGQIDSQIYAHYKKIKTLPSSEVHLTHLIQTFFGMFL